MEFVVHSPELAVGDPYVSRHEGIQECLDTPDMHERFEASIAAASQLAPNASALQAITYTADILRWGYWGEYGSPLPAGMKFAKTGKGTELHFDGERLDSGLFAETHGLIANCGFDDFERQVGHRLHQNAERIREFTTPVLERHPVVRLFRGIAEQESSERLERPLTEYEKVLGASIIGTEVKMQFGMHESEAFAKGSAAEFRYRRRLAQQELATMEDRPRNTAAHEIAKATIESYAHTLIGSDADFSHKKITSKEQAVSLLRKEAAERADPYHFRKVADYMIADLAKQPHDFSDSVVEYALGKILRNIYQNTEGTVSQTLDVGIADGVGGLYDRLEEVLPGTYSHPYSNLETFALLNQPRQETMTPTPPGYDVDDAYYALEAMGGTFWENVPEVPGSVGTVQADTSEHVGRLLHYRPVQAPYVSLHDAPRHDMSVTIENSYIERGLPVVPGYTLLARAAGHDVCTFFYEANQDDPYAECPLPIKDAGRQALVEAYREIGLVDLSIEVAEAGNLTIGRLTRMIARHSVYGNALVGPAKQISGVRDCADFVADGRLIAQCTGARAFLCSSLREASSADGVYGRVFLSFSGKALGLNDVPLQGHAQLGLIEDGKLYMLDATSSNALQTSDKQPQQLIKWTLPKREISPNTQANDNLYEMDNEGRLKILENTLSRILATASGDRAALLEKLSQLPQDDPMRVVYQISLGFKNDPESVADLYKKTIDFYPKLLQAIVNDPEVLIGTVYQRYANRPHQIWSLLDHLESYSQD